VITLHTHSFKTRMGVVHTAATTRGLAIISLPGEPGRRFEELIEKHFGRVRLEPGGEENKRAERQLLKYFNGELKQFDLRLDVRGTSFQKKVLRRVMKIPYGKTMTYGEVARAAGKSGAARAVGAVNAANALPLVIPCHRVVASKGLGGYGGGIAMKKALLEMEGAAPHTSAVRN
jgi:O-6-methylguanine DNA methyltransferase